MSELPDPSLRLLVDRAITDPDAFVALYHQFVGRVYGYVGARVGNRADAEDIVSDVFLRALKYRDQLQAKRAESFAAWLFSIAHHAVADYYRRDRPRRADQPLDTLSELPSTEPSTNPTRLENGEAAVLYSLVRALPERQREIVTLRYYGGLRNHEIAEVLGIGPKTVSAYLSRALSDLRQTYETQMQMDGEIGP